MTRISPVTGKPVQRRGFATLSPERRTEIAKLGGRSVPAEKRAYSLDHDLATSAGRKGGLASKGKRKARRKIPTKTPETAT